MNSWTLIRVSLVFLFSINLHAACDFQGKFPKIYSLAGSVTTLVKEVGLLTKLKGVSYFYPLTEKEFSGEFIPGGVFLSPELKKKLEGSLVFFDESQELKKTFSNSGVKAVEIKTRGLKPAEVTKLVIQELRPFVAGCEKEMEAFEKKSKNLEQELLKRIKKPLAVVFFLGEFHLGRAPEMVMSNDGVVKLLREEKKVSSYPSDLPYVNWSAKILNGLDEKTIKVGIKDSGRSLEKKLIRHSGQNMTMVYPGALIPGVDQLQAWNYWLDHL